ncbi:29963_t:CDS:1, partial [Gigaspora margarita]
LYTNLEKIEIIIKQNKKQINTDYTMIDCACALLKCLLTAKYQPLVTSQNKISQYT